MFRHFAGVNRIPFSDVPTARINFDRKVRELIKRSMASAAPHQTRFVAYLCSLELIDANGPIV